jgi:acyl dehydratase
MLAILFGHGVVMGWSWGSFPGLLKPRKIGTLRQTATTRKEKRDMSDIDTALAGLQARIGHEIGVSRWICVDQAMIDAFGHITHDTQWIHMDVERAATQSPYGTTIAHGFLTLSLASRFVYDCFTPPNGQALGINYGFNKLRFLSPVPAGARVRGRFVLKSIEKRSDTALLRETVLTIEIDGQDRPALVADWLGMMVFDQQ